MSSASLIDYFAEKIHSYSSKMRGDSLQHYSSYLMAGNSVQQYDPMRILTEWRENGIFEDSHHRTSFFNEVIEIFSSFQHVKHLLEKPELICTQNKNTVFSPHFLKMMSILNSFNYKSNFMSLDPYKSPNSEDLNMFVGKTAHLNVKIDSDMKKACVPAASDLKMPESVSNSPDKKKVDKTCSLSASVKLNVKLANRKTKQLNKRSRNRRRRQKKMRHLGSVSQSSSDYDDDDNVHSSISSSVCFVAETPVFECAVSVQRILQKPTLVSSFVMSVESDSDDDSDWESYDETDNCGIPKSNVDITNLNVPSPISSPVNLDSATDTCSSTSSSDDEMESNVFSFVVPVQDSSDDDSDWDTCDVDTSADVAEFEFTGLFVTNLCSFHPVPSVADCQSKIDTLDETDECFQLRQEVIDANEKWAQLPNVDERKSASKVKFAADDNLVKVYYVETTERKGEWEMYATERLRFKRRIDELEKVLSPCFNTDHRSKVFKKLIEPEL